MASTFSLEIVTPSRRFFSGDVDMIIFKTPQGDMGVLRGHIPMVVAVSSGPLRIQQNGQWREAALSEGFIETKQDKTIILVDTAEWPDEIDINRAEAAKERAEERLNRQLSKLEYMRTQAALSRALARLKVTKHK